MIPPTKRPASAEYVVLTVFVALVCLGLGIAAWVVAWRAPAEKPELDAELMRMGGWAIGIGLILLLAVRWLRRVG